MGCSPRPIVTKKLNSNFNLTHPIVSILSTQNNPPVKWSGGNLSVSTQNLADLNELQLLVQITQNFMNYNG